MSKVTGSSNPAIPSERSAFRFLIPTETLLTDPITQPLITKYGLDTMNITAGTGLCMVWYPCRGYTIHNFVALRPDAQSRGVVEDWQAAGCNSRDDLLTTFSDAHPSIKAVLEKAEDIKLWPLLFRKPLKSWCKGRCVLIGDAAHAMLPHQAQAAAQALEDGAALAVMLSQLQSNDEIPQRLELFEQVRINRASAMQIFSNIPHDYVERVNHDVQPYINGPVPTNTKDFRKWVFSHNVVKESLAIMREHIGVREVHMDEP